MKKIRHSKRFIRGVKKYVALYKLIFPLCFFILLFSGMLISLIIPLRPTRSELEKRDLAVFPKFSFSALADGSYFDAIDIWFADTFPFREKLIAANSSLEELRGFGDRLYGLNDNVAQTIPVPVKPEETETTQETTQEETEPEIPDQIGEVTQTLDNILVIGDSGYEYCSFHQDVADKYVSVLNKTASSLKGTSKVYSMLVPTSTDIMISDNVRKTISSCDQSAAMDYIYGSFSDDVTAVNIFKALRMHRDEYIYFRTDHHWTALGAYYAYRVYSEQAGLKTKELSSFTKESYGDFLGSFYSKTNSSQMKKHPDELIAYVPKYNTTMTYTTSNGDKMKWDLVHNVSTYPISQKYSAFAGADNPFTEIENLSKEKGKTCLVIKESFGNAAIPFIAGNYKKVYVIDYRYYKKGLISFAKQNGVDDIVFINNMSAVRSDKLIERMKSIAC